MKKLKDLIFCLLFVAVLVVPLIFTDFEKNKASEIDNEYLPELQCESVEAFVGSAENYLAKRIGFRTEMLGLYQNINNRLFSVMEHPDYMYGSDGHIFYKADLYIEDWQHLNLDSQWVESFTDGLKGFQDYTESKGKDFIYLLIPDKKTVYPEHFPKGYNILNETSRTDMLLASLDEKKVDYFWAKDAMLVGKEGMMVNNYKFDVTHWNENGAFVVLQRLFEELRQENETLLPLSKDSFDITLELKKYLPNSTFVINEEVPLYELKEENAVKRTDEIIDKTVFPECTHHYLSWHTNESAADAPSVLVIHDSYLAEKEKFFVGSFSSVVFLHRYNVYNQEVFEYYVEHFDPDIVIFETPERSLATEKLNLQREYTFEQ